jgi:hypothetical protein
VRAPPVSLLLFVGSIATAMGTARADWIANGNPVCVSAGDQTVPVGLPDGAGGLVVIWYDARSDSPGVYLRHVLASGAPAPGAPAGGRRVCANNPLLIRSDESGGVLIASKTSGPIYLQRITVDGDPVSAWPSSGAKISAPSGEAEGKQSCTFRDLAADGNGGGYITVTKIVAFYDENCPCIRRYTFPGLLHIDAGNGAPLEIAPAVAGTRVIGSARDGAIVYAPIPGRLSTQLACQRYAIDGTLIWDRSFTLPFDVGSYQGIADGHGGLIFVWAATATYGGLFALRVDRDGNLPAGWEAGAVRLSHGFENGLGLEVAPDSLGGALAAWTAQGLDQSSVQRVGADGVIPDGWPAEGVALEHTTNNPLGWSMIPDGRGGAALVFTRNHDLYVHHVRSNGGLDPAWNLGGLVLCGAAGDQGQPSAALDESGRALIAWQDRRAPADWDVYATRIALEDKTPTLIQAFEARSDGDRIEIAWRLTAPSQVLETRLERAPAASGPWQALTAAARAEGDRFLATDAAAGPGVHYYRLRIRSSDDRQWIFGPVSASVDGAIGAPGILSIRPNPSFGSIDLDFAAVGEGAVEIAVLDLAGREVARLASGSRAPGRHRITWDGRANRLAAKPGVYFVRFEQAGTVSTRPFVVGR